MRETKRERWWMIYLTLDRLDFKAFFFSFETWKPKNCLWQLEYTHSNISEYRRIVPKLFLNLPERGPLGSYVSVGFFIDVADLEHFSNPFYPRSNFLTSVLECRRTFGIFPYWFVLSYQYYDLQCPVWSLMKSKKWPLHSYSFCPQSYYCPSRFPHFVEI